MAGYAAMPIEAWTAKPTITWKHIDGPLMCWAGRMHWLTWRERWRLWTGKESPASVAAKIWPEYSTWHVVADPKRKP